MIRPKNKKHIYWSAIRGRWTNQLKNTASEKQTSGTTSQTKFDRIHTGATKMSRNHWLSAISPTTVASDAAIPLRRAKLSTVAPAASKMSRRKINSTKTEKRHCKRENHEGRETPVHYRRRP